MSSSESTLLIVYASVYGQTEKIARRTADVVRAEGVYADVVAIDAIPSGFDIDSYDAVIIAAPVHFGHHRRNAEEFTRRHLASLKALRSGLISVSLAVTGDRKMAQSFVHDLSDRTGWTPDLDACIAGSEAFTKYGFFTRWIMRRIARKHGRTPEMTRDYEYTDWDAVDRFARAFVRPIAERRAVSRG